jgi:hypothetical protein
MTRVCALVFWSVVAAIVFSTLCPIGLRPETGHVTLERAGAYFLFGVSFVAAFPRRPVAALALVPAVAAGLELAQRAVPSRHGHLADALVKAGGGVAGVVLALAALALWRALSSRGAPAPMPGE